MKIVVFAYHDIGCCALRTLHEIGENILAVFTHKDDPKENVWFESVQQCTQALGIPTFTPENPNTSEWIRTIRSFKPDILFSFYYRMLLSQEILDIPQKGSFNLHGSLLPKFRGRSPVNWAILKGEKETGITLHKMVVKADAGDIIAQKKVVISEEDTALTLFKKFVPLTRQLLLETVPLIAKDRIEPKAQDSFLATKFGGRKPEDGMIDWNLPSQEIYNLIRAVTHPYPGAFTFFDMKKLYLWWGNRVSQKGKPGEILSVDPLVCGCGDDALQFEKVQTDGEEEIDAQKWAKSHKIDVGMRFGK